MALLLFVPIAAIRISCSAFSSAAVCSSIVPVSSSTAVAVHENNVNAHKNKKESVKVDFLGFIIYFFLISYSICVFINR